MLLMRDSKYKVPLVILFGIILILGIVFAYHWQKREQPASKDMSAERYVDALEAVVDAANELSGITSGAEFTFEPENPDGKFTNFSIMHCRDEVRCDTTVKEHAFIFREIGGTGTAEVDRNTYQVVAMQRKVPDFVGNEEYPQEQIEATIRAFLDRVYPDFKTIEPTLTFSPGMKGTRLNTGNYFFRWEAPAPKLPDGIQAELPPYSQVGITASGFIFSYGNTIPLFNSVMVQGYEDVIEAMNDPAFTSYVTNTLAVRCPFYVPDGAGYRDCLWEVVNENEAAYTKATPSSQEIDNECQEKASNLDGLVAGEVVLSCRAYKLSL